LLSPQSLLREESQASSSSSLPPLSAAGTLSAINGGNSAAATSPPSIVTATTKRLLEEVTISRLAKLQKEREDTINAYLAIGGGGAVPSIHGAVATPSQQVQQLFNSATKSSTNNSRFSSASPSDALAAMITGNPIPNGNNRNGNKNINPNDLIGIMSGGSTETSVVKTEQQQPSLSSFLQRQLHSMNAGGNTTSIANHRRMFNDSLWSGMKYGK